MSFGRPLGLGRALGAFLLASALVVRAEVASPGPLSEPHAYLEGLTNCTQCHPAGKRLSQDKCLSCHTELAPSLEEGRGLHGRLKKTERSCEKCHHEHLEQSAALITWGPEGKERFDHERTGWGLQGRHPEVKCDGCHDPRRMSPTLKPLAEQRPHTLLGLSTQCDSCHFDEHRGQLEGKCDDCHDQWRWKPGPKFDHAKTDYPLEGKHEQVACRDCHPSQLDEAPVPVGAPAPRSPTFLKLNELPFEKCTDCHADPHRPSFGGECEGCHTVKGWDELASPADWARHDVTRYPLRGAHREVPCEACHGPSPGDPTKFRGLAFDACTACHVDAHLGQLGDGGTSPACDTCHVVDGFTPTAYEAKQHTETRFPLEGSHQVVGCVACHPRTPELRRSIAPGLRAKLKREGRQELFSLARFDFDRSLETCESCHDEPHGGQFEKWPGGCPSCHVVERFSKVTVDHRKDTKFPLEGKHAETDCEKCHVAPTPSSPVVYAPLPKKCGECHPDAHLGELGDQEHCEACHQPTKFSELKFRHAAPFTDWPLEGKHEKAKCQGCHPSLRLGELTMSRYKQTPRQCHECHRDVHQGRFAGFEPAGRLAGGRAAVLALGPLTAGARLGGEAQVSQAPAPCDGCHTTADWRGARFQHERTGFALTGAHQATDCTGCHATGYSTAPTPACRACHTDVHAGELGERCDGCHETSDWRSRYDADAHRRSVFPLLGAHATLPCTECHFEARERRFTRSAVECAACHQVDSARTIGTAVDHERLAFGRQGGCQACHGSVRFQPARFPTHDKCFVISKTNHAGLDCRACHSSLSSPAAGRCATGTAACTSCHTHACGPASETDQLHATVTGYQCNDLSCYRCHKP